MPRSAQERPLRWGYEYNGTSSIVPSCRRRAPLELGGVRSLLFGVAVVFQVCTAPAPVSAAESVPSRQSPSVSMGEVREALQAIVAGAVDVHFSLPREQPIAYALAFEFADEVAGRCPGILPRDFAQQRDALWWAYVHYAFWKRDAARARQMLGAWTLVAAGLRAVAMDSGGNYPAMERRKAIEPDVASLAASLLAITGGCGSAAMKAAADNLKAVGTFGTLARHALPATLLRREETANRLGFVCYYRSDEPATVSTQGYRNPTLFSLGQETPLGEFLDYIQRYNEGGRNRAGMIVAPPFIRSDCPLTIDPDFTVSREYVLPAPTMPSGSAAERIAGYFVDDYLPQFGVKSTGNPLRLDQAGLAKLRQEIIRFESIVVSMEDVDARIAAHLKDEQRRGVRSPAEPQWRMRQRFESSIRIQRYKAAGGTALFELATRENGVPNYLVARDVEVMAAMRGAAPN